MNTQQILGDQANVDLAKLVKVIPHTGEFVHKTDEVGPRREREIHTIKLIPTDGLFLEIHIRKTWYEQEMVDIMMGREAQKFTVDRRINLSKVGDSNWKVESAEQDLRTEYATLMAREITEKEIERYVSQFYRLIRSTNTTEFTIYTSNRGQSNEIILEINLIIDGQTRTLTKPEFSLGFNVIFAGQKRIMILIGTQEHIENISEIQLTYGNESLNTIEGLFAVLPNFE